MLADFLAGLVTLATLTGLRAGFEARVLTRAGRCFFLMAIWSIWVDKPYLLSLAVLFLGLISMRGMMLGFGLFGFSLFMVEGQIGVNITIRRLLPFLPGAVLAGSYLLFHWHQTGWVGYHEGSTWAPSFAKVDALGFLKNVGILIWRLLDFGRVFVWVVLLLILFTKLQNQSWSIPKIDRSKTSWKLSILGALVFVSIVPTQLFYKGLLAHRYLLPIFLVLNIGVLNLLFKSQFSFKFAKYRTQLASVICISLAVGNFWVYPQKIAMGWDSTLAHVPWYGLINDTKMYLRENGIPLASVGTAFPNIGSREQFELNGEQDGFVEKDFQRNCYLLYSNVMNDFTDQEIDELKSKWSLLHMKSVGGVCVVLYKNPNTSVCEN